MIASHVKEMVEAISANVDYLKKNQIASFYLKDGQLIQSSAGAFTYRFSCDYAAKIVDYQFDVLIGRDSYLGQLVGSAGKSIDIDLPENLGPSIASAEIAVGNYQLLEKLRDSLLEDRNRHPLGDELIGAKSAPKSPPLELTGLDQIGSHLNQYQRQALEFIDDNRIAYIWGPPGTGKTQTIASIIESLINNDLNVLLLSHTNIATDEALLKVCRQLTGRDQACLDDGRIIRVGKIQHQQLLEEFGPKVRVDDIAARRTLSIDKRINGYRESIAAATEEIRRLDSLKDLLDEQNRLADSSRSLQRAMAEKQASLKEADRQLAALGPQIEQVRQQIAQTAGQTGWSRLKGAHRLRKLQRLEDELNQKAPDLKQESARLRRELAAGQESQGQIAAKLEASAQQAKGLDPAQAADQLEKLKARVKRQEQLIKAAEKEKARISDSIIDGAQLIATTLTLSHLNKKVIGRDYDCVIVDEASMAPLPAVWYAAGLAKQRMVVVGDFCQLPPIVNYKDNGDKRIDGLVDKWLKKSIFQAGGIEAAISSQSLSLPTNLAVLREQHRMPKEVADLVNHIMYGRFRDGQFALISNGQPETRDHEVLAGQKFGLVETSACRPVSGRSGTGSPYCVFNALLIISLVDHAIKGGHQSIGVVTAYRAQANLIQVMIKDRGLDKNEAVQIEANTIHKFQGGERDLIIFDITVDYANSMYERGDAAKLLNVALSRTRQECLIVGNCQAIASNHRESSPTRQLLDHIQASGRPVLDAAEIVQRLMLPAPAGETPESAIRMASDRDFYPQFLDDANKAQREIVIVSPFLKLDRCQSMIDQLKPALARRILIFVITRRPPYGGLKTNTEHQQAMALLEKSGLVALPIGEKLHEKLALIDRELIWFGSLNIMSHKNSTDLMWRMAKGQEMIKQLANSYRLDKNIPQMGINTLEKCQKCGRVGAWFWNGVGKYGPWTYCLLGWHKQGQTNKRTM